MSEAGRDWRFDARRPSLPLPFVCGMALWAGCAASFTWARGLDAQRCLVAALACAVGSLAAGFLAAVLRRTLGRWGAGAIPICILLLGSCLGLAQGGALHADAQRWDGWASACEMTMLEDSSEGAYGERCLVAAKLEGGEVVRAIARLPDGCELRYGERIRAFGTFSKADFVRGDYEWGRGCPLTVRVSAVEREDSLPPQSWLIALRAKAIEALGDGSGAGSLLQALVCGYRRDVRGSQLYATFQTCGLAHLIAVSGAHLVIVTGLFASVLKVLRAPRKASVGVLVAVMASYLVFSGAPVSAIRATIMSSVGIMALFARRRPSALGALGVCLVVVVCASPSAAVSPSLALSALSTTGIVVFSPLVEGWIGATPLGKVPAVAEPLALTVAASVLSLPLACALFGKLPLVSPIANIACAPLFPLCCAFGLVAALVAALLPPLSTALHTVAAMGANMLSAIAGALSALPYASVPISASPLEGIACSCALAAVLWAAWSQLRPRHVIAAAGAGCLFLALASVSLMGDRIVMLDVGQGDAFLLQSRGRSLLIDTGNQDTALLKGLGANGAAHIDSVLVTHADDDHCGSLDALASAVDVDRVLVANGVLADGDEACVALVGNARAAARDVVELSYGDRFEVGAFSLTVLWPRTLADHAGNADSVCVLVEYDGDSDGSADVTALFTGDAEYEQVAQILQETGLHGVDILKVGHHGSRNAMTEEQARALSPRIALIGVGAHNRYGHPTQEALAALDAAGSAVYRTDEDGEVRCVLSPQSMRISCERADAFEG